jgi:hypothetical protein
MYRKELHFNIPQLRQELISANIEVDVWARGTGKTEGRIGPKSLRVASIMPRGATAVVGSTYVQLLDRLLPPLFLAWDRLGYKKDVHYWVRRRPDKRLGIPEAYYAPDTPEHCIYWYNGHIQKLISQDRPGTSNGMSVDFVIGDEAKLLDKTKFFEELSPTNRGNEEVFGHLSEHHGILLCTDMPTTPSGSWIFEFQKEHSQELIDLILNLQFHRDELHRSAQVYVEAEQRLPQRLAKQIDDVEFELFCLRKDAVSYSEASAMDNIDYLTMGYIRRQRKTLPKHVFDAAIMNIRTYKGGNSYYSSFDAARLSYSAYNYSYIDSLGLYLEPGTLNDCRKDADLIPGKELRIAMDYGGFNCLIAAQQEEGSINLLKEFYGQRGTLTTAVVEQFCDYYQYHPEKRVTYYYDQTAVATDGRIDESFSDQVIATLKARDWDVNPVYLGAVMAPDARYKLFEAVYEEKNSKYRAVRINRDNCPYTIISIEQADKVEDSKGRIKKDKRNEKKHSHDQRMTTHFSDAHDTLYIGSELSSLGQGGASSDILFS